MEIPRLGVQSELQLLTYTIATATPDPSLVCNLPHSSQQHWILKPLSQARGWTCNLMVPGQIHFHCATSGTPEHTLKQSEQEYASGDLNATFSQETTSARNSLEIPRASYIIYHFIYFLYHRTSSGRGTLSFYTRRICSWLGSWNKVMPILKGWEYIIGYWRIRDCSYSKIIGQENIFGTKYCGLLIYVFYP